MKVAFFMQDTGAVYGAERATIDLAAGLRAVGVAVLFFLMRESRLMGKSAFLDTLSAEGFETRLFPVAGRMSLRLARSVRRAFATEGVDVLHVVGYKANLHAALAGIRPRITTVHGWLFRADAKERLYAAIERWCLRRCDRVICLSTYYERLLLASGVARDRLVRIPSGLRNVPSDREATLSALSGRPVVLGMLGRFSEEKNHGQFLQAACAVHRAGGGIRLVLAGEGHLKDAMIGAARDAGLADITSFPGYLPVPAFMSSIDVYVICSRIENLPYSILEAMAWGRPVIGSRVGGIPDLVREGETGWLVNEGDAASLASAMKECLEQPERLVGLGAAGRKRVREVFSLEAMVEAHRALYASTRRTG